MFASKVYCNKIYTEAINTKCDLTLSSIISSVMYCCNYTENAVVSLFCAVTVHICDYYHRSVSIHYIYEKKSIR